MTYTNATGKYTHSGADPGKSEYIFTEEGTYDISIDECNYSSTLKIITITNSGGARTGYTNTLTPQKDTKKTYKCRVIVKNAPISPSVD